MVVFLRLLVSTDTASSFCPARTIDVNFPPPLYASTVAPPTEQTKFPMPQIDFKTGTIIGYDSLSSGITTPPTNCHFGWAFVLAAMNCVILVFLPILSHFIVTEPETLNDLKITNV